MKIDRNEARRIASLAHIEMDDSGLDRMAREMTEILTYIDQLTAIDLGGADQHAQRPLTPMRDDVPGPALDRDLVAANAPAWLDGLFVVPKVIGE